MVNNKYLIILFLLCIVFTFCGCEKNIPKDQIVAKINDYEMTVKDFTEKIEFSPYASNKMPDKKNMMNIAIQEQVLIQEAQKMGLDKNKTFMKTIERYWQQTLIKELLQQKNREISEKVTKDDRAKALNDWIKGIQDSADIEVYDDVLEKIEINEDKA